ncbi:carboxymuconolactone decarboxylase family protein [Myceligenerans crystallogenes]|uniref:Carboxymuconolactone decarboxylase family protein n=1 Tax=Myceligenerans crystallogenes TaxID=316335 RepID=A0ABN2NIP4_9MICO
MEARLKKIHNYLPTSLETLQAAAALPQGHGVPGSTLELVHLRVSQINGCGWCLEYGLGHAKESGLTDKQLVTLAGWRESPHFSDAERAAIALAEEATRIADNPRAVPDDVWDEAARHYDEEALAAIVLHVAMVNLWNRLNVTTRQVAGTW